eukprot:jgi/Psemu1/43606/gm1.43606_g
MRSKGEGIGNHQSGGRRHGAKVFPGILDQVLTSRYLHAIIGTKGDRAQAYAVLGVEDHVDDVANLAERQEDMISIFHKSGQQTGNSRDTWRQLNYLCYMCGVNLSTTAMGVTRRTNQTDSKPMLEPPKTTCKEKTPKGTTYG